MFTSPSALSFNLLTISPSQCLLPCHAVPGCHDWGLSRRSRCHTKFLPCSDRTAPRLELLLPRTYTVHQSARTLSGKIHTMNTSTNQSYKRTKTNGHNMPQPPQKPIRLSHSVGKCRFNKQQQTMNDHVLSDCITLREKNEMLMTKGDKIIYKLSQASASEAWHMGRRCQSQCHASDASAHQLASRHLAGAKSHVG